MTWERLNSLVLQHWTPRVRPARGSPVPTWGNVPSSCFSFLSSGWTRPGIPTLLESGKWWSRVICLDNDWQSLRVLQSCAGKGISMRVSRRGKLCYKSEPNCGDVVTLAHFEVLTPSKHLGCRKVWINGCRKSITKLLMTYQSCVLVKNIMQLGFWS